MSNYSSTLGGIARYIPWAELLHESQQNHRAAQQATPTPLRFRVCPKTLAVSRPTLGACCQPHLVERGTRVWGSFNWKGKGGELRSWPGERERPSVTHSSPRQSCSRESVRPVYCHTGAAGPCWLAPAGLTPCCPSCGRCVFLRSGADVGHFVPSSLAAVWPPTGCGHCPP